MQSTIRWTNERDHLKRNWSKALITLLTRWTTMFGGRPSTVVLGPNWANMDYIFNPLYWLQNVSMQSWWHRYVRKTLLVWFQFLKVSVKANFYFEPWVQYPTTGNHTSTRGKYQLANFIMAAIFWVIATVKTRPVLKRACQELSAEECTYWKRLWGPDEKLIFSNHDSEI